MCIDNYFTLKPSSVGDPDIYLGAKLRKMTTPNGVRCLSIGLSKYVQEAVNNCKINLKQHCDGKYVLLKEDFNPFAYHYEPKVDISEPYDTDIASYYQSIIGIIRCMIKLGCGDTTTEVSMFSSQNTYLCEVNVQAALPIMYYLNVRHNSRLALDSSQHVHDGQKFKDNYWTDFYGDVKQAIPLNTPTPLGKSFDLRMLFDSDHAGDKLSRKSCTGFLMFCNIDLINWLSKNQTTVESTVFGDVFLQQITKWKPSEAFGIN